MRPIPGCITVLRNDEIDSEMLTPQVAVKTQDAFKLRSLWHFVRASISADTELLLYFVLFSVAQTIPFFVGFRILYL